MAPSHLIKTPDLSPGRTVFFFGGSVQFIHLTAALCGESSRSETSPAGGGAKRRRLRRADGGGGAVFVAAVRGGGGGGGGAGDTCSRSAGRRNWIIRVVRSAAAARRAARGAVLPPTEYRVGTARPLQRQPGPLWQPIRCNRPDGGHREKPNVLSAIG